MCASIYIYLSIDNISEKHQACDFARSCLELPSHITMMDLWTQGYRRAFDINLRFRALSRGPRRSLSCPPRGVGTQKREVKDPEEDGDGETPALSQAVGASLAGYGIAALSVSWSVRCDVSLYLTSDLSKILVIGCVLFVCLFVCGSGLLTDHPTISWLAQHSLAQPGRPGPSRVRGSRLGEIFVPPT